MRRRHALLHPNGSSLAAPSRRRGTSNASLLTRATSLRSCLHHGSTHATAARGPSRRNPTLVMPSPRVHWRPMPSVSHAAFGGRQRRAVLAATPVSGGRSVTQAGSDRALSTFKTARVPARRLSRPVRQTAGPGSLELLSLMQTMVGTRGRNSHISNRAVLAARSVECTLQVLMA